VADFLIDEHVSPRLVEPLEQRGHRAYHVRQLGLAGANDATILLAAVRRSLIVITENHQDFLNLHQAWQIWSRAWRVRPLPAHPGIPTIPQLPVARLSETAGAIAQLIGSGRRYANELHQWIITRVWELYPV
jgi:hypothetical protein